MRAATDSDGAWSGWTWAVTVRTPPATRWATIAPAASVA